MPPRALAVVPALLTAALFGRAVTFPFLAWDDRLNLAVIPGFRGETSSDLSWILTAHVMGHWVPLTWASFALDWALWGRDARGYHATSVVLHALNSALVYLVARRLLRAAGVSRPWALAAGSLVAALAFGLHPLRVESVAWVTERRDVLSGAGFLLSVLAYLRAVQREGRASLPWLMASVLAFAGALLAKQSTIALPAVLLLLDVYPLGRWPAGGGAVVREKLPYAVLALAGTAVLAASMAGDIGFTPLGALGPDGRLALLAHALVYYPLQTAAPVGLSPLHEMPARLEVTSLRVLPSVVVAVAVTAVAIATRRRAPWLLAAWTYGALVLLPMSGVLHAPGTNLVADRYSYLGTLGWAVLLGGGVAVVVARVDRHRNTGVVLAACAAVLALWTVLTWRELDHWRDDERLWRAALAQDPECASCRGYLAAELLAQGRFAAATEEAMLAARLRPDLPVPLAILGYTRQALGDLDGAATALTAAARLDARYEGRARTVSGVALRARGRLAEAAGTLRSARILEPSRTADAELARTLGSLAQQHLRSGRASDAVRALEEAQRLQPQNPEIARSLAAARASSDSSP